MFHEVMLSAKNPDTEQLLQNSCRYRKPITEFGFRYGVFPMHPSWPRDDLVQDMPSSRLVMVFV